MVLTGRTVVAHQLILSGQTHDVLFISFSGDAANLLI